LPGLLYYLTLFVIYPAIAQQTQIKLFFDCNGLKTLLTEQHYEVIMSERKSNIA